MTLQIYKIATTEVGSAGASSIDFTNIPQGYRDLLVVISGRAAGTGGAYDGYFTINGSSATNYQDIVIKANGASASSQKDVTQASAYAGVFGGGSTTANTFTNHSYYFPNYTSSNAKTVNVDTVQENNATTAYAILSAQLWNQTAAITSLSYTIATTTFAQYSKATLYGIL